MGKLQKGLRTAVVFLGGVLVGLGLFRWILINREKNALHSSSSHDAQAKALENAQLISDFSFIDGSGKTVSRSDLLGNIWIADFIFTRCMGPCPLLSSAMAKLQDEFTDKKNLKFVSFTVDPAYDTPQVLSQYADTFGADKNRWYFLTGDKDKVYKLIQESFHLAVTPGETDPMQVVHSLSFVLVGKKGEMLGYFNATDAPALAELRKQLKVLK